MINYREIFDVNNIYIGFIVLIIIMVLLVMLDRENGVKNIMVSFFIAGFILLGIVIIGNLLVSSLYFKFFIEVISNTFFSFVMIGGGICFIISFIGILFYRYVIG